MPLVVSEAGVWFREDRLELASGVHVCLCGECARARVWCVFLAEHTYLEDPLTRYTLRASGYEMRVFLFSKVIFPTLPLPSCSHPPESPLTALLED